MSLWRGASSAARHSGVSPLGWCSALMASARVGKLYDFNISVGSGSSSSAGMTCSALPTILAILSRLRVPRSE